MNPMGAVENSLAAVGEDDLPAGGKVEMSEDVLVINRSTGWGRVRSSGVKLRYFFHFL